MSTQTSERFYYILAVVGFALTWYFNIQFFTSGGSVAHDSFFVSAFANPLTTAITLDVYWSALVFSIWVVVEKNEPAAPRPWAYIVLCFAIGLAFALPLYLGSRQHLRRTALRVS